MTITSLIPRTSRPAGTFALAAGLAFGAGAAVAAPVTASVSVTGFTVTTTTADAYVWPVDAVAYQQWTMTALNAGGLLGAQSNNFSANNLDPVTRLAQTSMARARGNTETFTDPLTALSTYGMTVSATAFPSIYAPSTPSNSANATGLQQGGFTLIDAFGNALAGELSFTVYYDIDVAAGFGSAPGTYGQSSISLLASDDAGDSFSASDDMTSYTQPGGVGSRSGSFTWSFALQAYDTAYYTLGATAVAFAVPEPGVLLLAATGLLGAALAGQRRRPTNAIAA